MRIILLFIILTFTSCERYVLENSDVTLSGKYVVSKLDITSVDQNTSLDSSYSLGSKYVNRLLPPPFDSIVINRFYLHMDYSVISLDYEGVDSTGRDMWGFQTFYTVFGNTTYSSGYLQFDRSGRRIIFYIEDDGIESLQLKSSGAWFQGKFGEKQVMTLKLTRVGP